MRVFIFLLIILLATAPLEAQDPVSVYDCNAYTEHITQAEFDANTNIFGSCFTIDNVLANGSDYKTVWASDRIDLKEGTHLGGPNNSGKVHLLLSEPSKIDVAVMNYNNLNGVKKFKKLEFGIHLSDGLNDSISNFINKQGPESARLNPFVDWDIDVEAVFYHSNPGWGETINGFFTRDYIEVGDTGFAVNADKEIVDDWLDVDSIPGKKGNEYPFRIRYAPPKLGKWTCQVSIKIKGELVYKSDNFYFNVVESGDPGYVHVHENKCNLKRGKRMIFPVGHNATTIHSLGWGGGDDYPGVNHYSSTNSEKAANPLIWDEYLENIRAYLQKGGKYLRTIQAPWFSLIEFEERGNYFKRLHYASETDKLLDTLEKYDALVCFNLMMHTPIMKYGDFDMNMWDWGKYEWDGEQWHDSMAWNNNYDIPYCYNDKPFGEKEPYEMFTDPEDLNYHKQRIRYYNARYGYSTKIYEFEILSEPYHLGEYRYGVGGKDKVKPFKEPNAAYHSEIRNAVYNYHNVISKYMKDSLRVNQLVGMDMDYSTEGFDEKSIKIPEIDIVGFNPYFGDPRSIYDIHDYVNKIGFTRLVNITGTYSTEFGDFPIYEETGLSPIPVVIPEGGEEPWYECSDYDTYPVVMMAMGFTGLAGYNAWNGWDKDQGDIRDITIRVQKHMNGNDVINTLKNGWSWSRQEAYNKGWVKNYSVEHQYYISNNLNLTVGYVYNRRYNVITRAKDDDYDGDCEIPKLPTVYQLAGNVAWNDVKNNERLRIDGLKKKTTYNIYWYSAFQIQNNGYIKYDCIETDRKLGRWGITLKYPNLTSTTDGSGDVPTVWYVVRKGNCNPGMTPQPNVTNEEINIQNKIKVYPNPFDDSFTIISERRDQLILKSIDGKNIGTFTIKEGVNRIVTSHLSEGIYLGTLVNQNTTFKIIKQ